MNNKQFAVTVFSIIFGIICFVWAVLMGVMAKDLVNKVKMLEEQKNFLQQEKMQLQCALEERTESR